MISESVSLSDCLVTRLNSALLYKTDEQIEILFVVNTFGCPRSIVLDRGLEPPQLGERKLEKISPIVDPIHILETALTKNMQK